jgi:predicted nucleotidyltransferase component of viral defense system
VRPLHTRLQDARKRLGIPWEVLERDYVLSWVLAGLSRVSALRDTLVSKGGAALRKCYFGEYRFSQDLDFSGVGDVPTGESMAEAIQDACLLATELLDQYAPVQMMCERCAERDPHPGRQEAFTVRARLPWHRQPHTRVMIEVSVDEKVLRPPSERPIIHEYDEPLNAQVWVYALEEILAEKLRAILQHVEKLRARGWARSCARHYYDLWRVLGAYSEVMDLTDFAALLREKCAVRGVGFDRPDDFFHGVVLANVEQTWDQWLGPLVPGLPPFATVMGELRPHVERLLSAESPDG